MQITLMQAANAEKNLLCIRLARVKAEYPITSWEPEDEMRLVNIRLLKAICRFDSQNFASVMESMKCDYNKAPAGR